MTGPDERVLLEAPATAELARVFGDGGHATTALALELLEASLAARPDARVLDAGAGTGVLAERALAAGAREVVAIDREVEAIDLVRVRAPAARALCRDLRAGLRDLGRFDVVVANLPVPELCACADSLANAAPGGRIIASGMPLVFARRVERALVAAGLAVTARRARLGWCALVAAPQLST